MRRREPEPAPDQPGKGQPRARRGSDGPPAPGPLGTVVFAKEARVWFWVSRLGRSAKAGKWHYTMSIYASCLHQKEVQCYAKSLTKNSIEKPKSQNKKQTSTWFKVVALYHSSLSVRYFSPFPKQGLKITELFLD